MTDIHVHESVPLRRGLVVDPEGKHYRQIRGALWLYLYLLLAVNQATGKRLVSPPEVARDMGLREETVRSWLGHLRKAGYVSLRREGGLLWVTIARWRKRVAHEREMAPLRPDREARKPRTSLTPERLGQSLGGDPKDRSWAAIVAAHKPELLEDVLAEVLRVPEEKIKKSRLALFHYLLKKRS